MIMSTKMDEKYDRLTAFLRVYALRTEILPPEYARAEAHLFIAFDARTREASHIELAMRGITASTETEGVAARVIFGGEANPLLVALPERLSIPLTHEPALRGAADLFVDEARQRRCGGATVQSRLGEVIVVLAIRRAIARGAVGAGLLAGLAHPSLHRSLVAMHDDPGRQWQITDLSALAEMSRGYFITQFHAVLGQTPAAYLTAWRLTLGRQALLSGHSVKTVAHQVGFGSAASFSRAFSRRFGQAPACMRSA
jgi:AraC-like DNA-binding protein